MADPAFGLAKVSVKEFLCGWESTQAGGKGKWIALLLEPTPDFYAHEEERQRQKKISFVLRYFKPYRKQGVQLFLGILLGAFYNLFFLSCPTLPAGFLCLLAFSEKLTNFAS